MTSKEAIIIYSSDDFTEYLKKHYTEFTKNGEKSTVYDYCFRVERICRNEGSVNINELAVNIDDVIGKYDTSGDKESLGTQSHRANINALKAFRNFLADCNKEEM